MAVEAKRGCGYRKVGGLYLVTLSAARPCGLLPRELVTCPRCGRGIRQSRGWAWVEAGLVTRPEDEAGCPMCSAMPPAVCPMRVLAQNPKERAGLLWVGERHYPTPGDFEAEAQRYGISKRIAAVPGGFKVGETWVLLAHPRACPARLDPECVKCGGSGEVLHPEIARQMEANLREQQPEALARTFGVEMNVPCPTCSKPRPGVFALFRPTAIEIIVTQSQAQDAKYMAKLAKRGLSPVVVPDGDPDHDPRAAERVAVA